MHEAMATVNHSKSSQETTSKSQQEETVSMEYLHDHMEEIGLQVARSCISVGPGTGRKDCHLLRRCMPRVQRYYALEPDRHNLQLLKQALQKERTRRRGGLEVRLKLQRVETWAGPPEKVDVILMFHVLQYVREFERPSMLRRLHDWLAPRGSFLMMVQKGCAEWEDLLTKHCGISDKQLGLDRQARHSLELAGLKSGVKEHHFSYNLDVSSPSYALLSYFLNRQASDQDLYTFSNRVKETFPSGEVPFQNFLFVYKKA